ncbi:hypothetical protein LIA77_11999 [Sarocladium implicatum]|nr:hypothetical protein LIA77_11999 [Sarocladium implicatum]
MANLPKDALSDLLHRLQMDKDAVFRDLDQVQSNIQVAANAGKRGSKPDHVQIEKQRKVTGTDRPRHSGTQQARPQADTDGSQKPRWVTRMYESEEKVKSMLQMMDER